MGLKMIRIDEASHKALKKLSLQDGRSMRWHLTHAISDYLKRLKKGKKK